MDTIRQTIGQQADLLREFAAYQLSPATPQLLEQARQIATGTVFFYDVKPVQVGLAGIDWAGGHIRHQEWPAVMNRFYMLAPLASAWVNTRDETFACAARAYIGDWLDGDRYGDGAPCRAGDNTLTMSIRLGNSRFGGWGGLLAVFMDSPSFDDVFIARMLDSIERQANWLAPRIATYGNWRICALDSLIFTALRFPFMSSAARWLATARPRLEAAFGSQFLPDGAHAERSVGYHDWMASVAADYHRLSRLVPSAAVAVDEGQLVRMQDYSAAAALAGLNDCSWPLRDPDRLAALDLRGETLRRLGLADRAGKLPPLAQAFRHAGQVYIRSSWSSGAEQLAFDAAGWGGGHTHLSRLSLVFRNGGRALLADPGIFTYEMSDPMGPYGKSTPAHSTLNVDGLSQAPVGAELMRTEIDGRVALLHGRYEGGYWDGVYRWHYPDGHGRGVFGCHDRVVFYRRGEYVLVIDRMVTDPGHQVRSVWQFAPVEGWSADQAARSAWSTNAHANLAVQWLGPADGVTMAVRQGSRDPLAGWAGMDGQTPLAAPQIEFTCTVADPPTGSAVLLTPFAGAGCPPPVQPAWRSVRDGAYHVLQWVRPNGTIDRIAWSARLEIPLDVEEMPDVTAPLAWQRIDSAGRVIEQWVSAPAIARA